MTIKRIMTVIGLVFLVGCGVVFYKNYISYGNVEKDKTDTLKIEVNTIIIDTLKK